MSYVVQYYKVHPSNIVFRILVFTLLVGSVFHLKRSIEATNCMKQNDGLVYLHLSIFTTESLIFAVKILIRFLLKEQAIELNHLDRHDPEGIAIRISIQGLYFYFLIACIA